jgi:hypothetical protein
MNSLNRTFKSSVLNALNKQQREAEDEENKSIPW